MDRLKEECGVVAVYQMGNGHERNVYSYVVRALLEMQNRGQLSAGLTTYNPDRNRILQTHKDLGTVHEVFRLHTPHKSQLLMEEYAGRAAIGHNRYATSGQADSANAQPFERVHGRMWKWFAIAFNGNLANYDQLKEDLESHGYHITYHSDTEVMMHYINREMRGDEPPDFGEMFANLARIFDGAYNIAFLNAAGDLVVMRDPLGIKPMCYAVQDDLLIVASESVVHHNLNIGADDVKTLEPGEMIIANHDGFRVERFWPAGPKRYCFFEWVYFSNLASNLEGRSVYGVRNDVGRELAEMELQGGKPPVGEMVISIPETANTVASSFGYHLGLPVVAGLLRNRYVGRTFIDGTTRDDAVRMKFTPLTDVLEGRKIYLVDDTLVRGTTLKTVIAILKERGRAKEVHVRIGCPPVMGPCFYGIDMPTVRELFAPSYLMGNGHHANGNGERSGNGNGHNGKHDQKVLEQMASDLGADSLSYLSMEGLVSATGMPKDDLCLACINSDYPTEWGRKRYQESLDKAGLG
ncbi:MAG TPA: amidophosphoribosyltransferase [bacterium]|nr:amidophosphoribosyltransferase [bacterium]